MSPAGGSSPFRIDIPFTLNDGSTFSISMSPGIDVLPNGTALEAHPVSAAIPLYPTR